MLEKNEKELQKLENKLNNERVLQTAGLAYEDFLEELFDSFEDVDHNPNFPAPPKNMVVQIDAAVNKEIQMIKHLGNRRRLKSWGIKFAACFVVFCVGASTLAISVRASRADIANYLISSFSQFSEIRYTGQIAQPPIGWFNPYYPTWLPSDYAFAKIALEAQADIIWYKDRGGHEISFCVMHKEQRPNIDTERMISEELIIQNHQAMLFTTIDGRVHTLIIPHEDYIIVISGEVTRENVIEIGCSIKLN